MVRWRGWIGLPNCNAGSKRREEMIRLAFIHRRRGGTALTALQAAKLAGLLDLITTLHDLTSHGGLYLETGPKLVQFQGLKVLGNC